ncbi:MAG TPA: hypothetical protein VIL10_09375 [Marmoricola sp.]
MSADVLLVPVDGLMEWFVYDVDPQEILKQHTSAQVCRIELNTDNQPRGEVIFGYNDTVKNERATAITGLVCGSFVLVTGPAVFYGLDEGVVGQIMREVA